MSGSATGWGRHGWPKKGEGYRLYRERNGAYLIMDPERWSGNPGYFWAAANVYDGPKPSLASTEIRHNYTYEKGCKRVQWSELPDEWQRAFRAYMDDPESPFVPEQIRGLWLVENFPGAKAC